MINWVRFRAALRIWMDLANIVQSGYSTVNILPVIL